VSWSQEELVAAAYAVVFVFVLAYVAIIAAKLVRLQRETAELVELAQARRGSSDREPDYAATVSAVGEGEVGAS
jgi:CcmD family protein